MTLDASTRARINELVRYITDDGYIAGYLHIDRKHVVAARANMPPEPRTRSLAPSTGQFWGTGTDDLRKGNSAAAQGSSALLTKMLAAYDKRAKRDEAALLMLGRAA